MPRDYSDAARRIGKRLPGGLKTRENIEEKMRDRFPDFTDAQINAFSDELAEQHEEEAEDRGLRLEGDYVYNAETGQWHSSDTGHFVAEPRPFGEIPERFETQRHRYVQGRDKNGRPYFRRDGKPISRDEFSRSWVLHAGKGEIEDTDAEEEDE